MKKRSKTLNGEKGRGRKKTGPHLPNQLRKQVESLNPTLDSSSDEEDALIPDVYEYEERFAEEESKKNRRFDPVDNFQYELPEDFKDEEVPSDDDSDEDDDISLFTHSKGGSKNKRLGDNFDNESESEDGVESEDGESEDGENSREEDVERRVKMLQGNIGVLHQANNRMDDGDDGKDDDDDELRDEPEEDDSGRRERVLQKITGLPSSFFKGKKRTANVIVSERYPESEYNPTDDGNGRVNFQDLLESLHGTPGYHKLRKRSQHVEKKSAPLQAPLPKVDQDRLERKVAYKISKEQITKWEPQVKQNREAPTIYFDENTNLGFSTVGAIASGFNPRTDFEKKMASLVHDDEIVQAHRSDGARLLELNKISAEDVKDRQNQLAKMNSLLFQHEVKFKRIKKIKSKTYHRLLKKDKMKAASVKMLLDPEAAEELAMKQEFKRAEERMTLKHKNRSKWAKRILKRGLSKQDEGTRAAITEQLHAHARLTRKIDSMRDGSSSSDTSDNDDGYASAGSDEIEPSKLLAKAKDKTLKVIEDEDEVPNSGVLSLPFMKRGLKKRKEAAQEEAKLALEAYESSLKEIEDTGGVKRAKMGKSSGRRVFGTAKSQVKEASAKDGEENFHRNSDTEDDILDKETSVSRQDKGDRMPKDVKIDINILREESEIAQDPALKSFDDVVSNPGPKSTYEVAICASDSWRKIDGKVDNAISAKKSSFSEKASHISNLEEGGEDSDTDSGGQMVDGILSSGSKPTYALPSQQELIRRAFAGDDVEEDFQKDKAEVLNEENPEPEKPALIPGWGQWTNVQKRKGLPSWMLEEHEIAKQKREEALKKRKDAHLKHVVISEKLDKKAEKFHTKTLPYPYTSQEVFEQSIRMPIGPEFNPATVVGALTRPEVVKKPGVIIKPIEFKDVNPYEKSEEHEHGRKKVKNNKRKGVETSNKMKSKGKS